MDSPALKRASLHKTRDSSLGQCLEPEGCCHTGQQADRMRKIPMHSRPMNITHADVERALARFRHEGRGITRLEPQATPRRSSVRDPAGGVDNLLDQVMPEMAAGYGSGAGI